MSTLKTNQLAHTANGASVYTLPQTDGSAGQVLTTNGSGVLSWASDKGKILQVQQTHLSTRHSNTTASGAEWAPSQLNCSITPSATSSNVLITAKVAIGFNVNTRRVFMKVFRDSTQIAQGSEDTGNSSITRASSSVDIRYDDVVEDIVFSFLDTGISTTSSTTYSFRFTHSQTADGIIYINRAHTRLNRVQDAHLSSNVILQEVAG